MIAEMNSAELKEKMDRGEEFILVDVREQNEWDAGHIPGALFIPLSQFENEYPKHLTNPDADIVIQCRSGKRSLDACQRLLGEGFTKLTNLSDGILGWMDEGFPVQK